MRDPFIAIDAATDLRAHARVLRRSWESALGGGAVAAPVRPVIQQSWQRMVGAGVDPDHLQPQRAFAVDELDDRRSVTRLAMCIEVLRRSLGNFALDGEHVMVVVDDTGRILWLEGHPQVRHQADAISFEEGMLWTEVSAGTNAIGTALAIDHAVQIFSAEHFLPEQHPWWCSAAPIHDPVNGEVLGVVDLSGPTRTAHPHSLALVMAAASMAEDVLRLERSLADNVLRQAYLYRADHGRGAGALVADNGRVLLCHPEGWAPGLVEIPAGDGGLVGLGDGRSAMAEPLAGGGWALREAPGGTAALPRPRLRLRLLGRGRLEARLGAAPGIELGLRHAEILALLAIHPDGLTGEELTLHLYGDRGNRVSTRAEMSRLRKLLGPCVGARPYRLVADVEADFLRVERRLAAGDLEGALADYRGPLLAASEAPRIAQARDELEGALARAARAGGPERMWTWLQTEPGREDPLAMADFVRALPASDPRRGVVASRLRALQRRWEQPL
jgi:GAF domain-containing protein